MLWGQEECSCHTIFIMAAVSCIIQTGPTYIAADFTSLHTPAKTAVCDVKHTLV